MDEEPVIRVRDVSKAYRLGHERSNLRAALPGRLGEPRRGDWFYAVENVSFEVNRGEAFGIIGSNGAGKSTVLKLLAGVVAPTSGTIERPQRLVSIIELGLGFDPDLTGEENLEYGGALLGLTTEEVAAHRDEIMEFAELEPFATMPVKRYSTGMLARLGFALATTVDAEVFVVDEVLSVGDWGFQRKSLQRMRELNERGSTIVFVSHNLWVVNQLCDRVALLDHGRLVDQGSTQRVLGVYLGQTPLLVTREGVMAVASSATGGGVAGGMAMSVDQLPDEVREDPSLHDWRPVVITDIRCEPSEIHPGDPMALIATIDVRQVVPGLRLVVGAYWEGFAGFAVPDEIPSDFFGQVGQYRVRIEYPMITAAPAVCSFQVAVVSSEEPEDPEQLLPHAVERARAEVNVLGDLSSRPGVYFPRAVRIEHLGDDERVLDIVESVGPGVPEGWFMPRAED